MHSITFVSVVDRLALLVLSDEPRLGDCGREEARANTQIPPAQRAVVVVRRHTVGGLQILGKHVFE
ncbi:hypothetical protein E2C01_003792 [Portunus trituberculatus]|uniref:Secreted protein n=1 Tax=Portunus trituberculatus TaxID=210409 RepID=A0A5B7CR43_PORTR|nr:hypothetical protein [Portunus trituberculatus]